MPWLLVFVYAPLMLPSPASCSSHHPAGPKLKDFRTTVDSDPAVLQAIKSLKGDVESYAMQFPTIAFEKATMRYSS